MEASGAAISGKLFHTDLEKPLVSRLQGEDRDYYGAGFSGGMNSSTPRKVTRLVFGSVKKNT